MKKRVDNPNRRKFLKILAAGTCGAACHSVLGGFSNLAYATGGNGPDGRIKNFIELFFYGGCCSQGMSPVFNAGAQARYPTLYRTPGQAAAIPGTSAIGLHAGLAPMILEANRTKSSVALVIGTGHPTTYSRSHDEAQRTNEHLAYNANLPQGVGVGAQIAQQIGDNFGLIAFGGESDFSTGGIIPARSVSNLNARREQPYLHDGMELTQGMIRSTSNSSTAAQQYVQESIDSVDTLLPILAPLATLTPPGNFPNNSIGDNLKDVARLIMGRVGSVFFLPYSFSQTSFDTHSNQAAQHNTLFNPLGPALAQLIISLKAIPGRAAGVTAWDETVIAVRTDFGRTWENNGQGTDHGHAYNQLLIGGRVNGGVHGNVPTAANYQNASGYYMDSSFVQFNAMQPTKEIAQAMGLNVSDWPSYPGNLYSPIGLIA